MFIAYVVFALVWSVVVAAAQPPLIIGALLVAAPILIIGYILRNGSDLFGAP